MKNLFNTLVALTNKELNLELYGDEALFTKIFSRKLFREQDLKNIFFGLIKGDYKRLPATKERMKLEISKNYLMVVCSNGYIVSLTDKRHNY